MYILSQNGDTLVQADNLSFEYYPQGVEIVKRIQDGYRAPIALGLYHDIDRAKKQLINIARIVGQGGDIYHMEKDDA